MTVGTAVRWALTGIGAGGWALAFWLVVSAIQKARGSRCMNCIGDALCQRGHLQWARDEIECRKERMARVRALRNRNLVAREVEQAQVEGASI